MPCCAGLGWAGLGLCDAVRCCPQVGPFFRDAVATHFEELGQTVNVKYIDPSYMIRSVAANASDSLFCMLLAQATAAALGHSHCAMR